MQTNQVSLWVPIAVGIIGLVGVIAGQLVNAWREDRRWKREANREDLRWKREQLKESTRLQQENGLNWRESRLSTYGDLLSSLQEVQDKLIELTKTETFDDARAAQESASVAVRQAFDLIFRTRLLCGTSLLDLLNEKEHLIHEAVVPFYFLMKSESNEVDQLSEVYAQAWERKRGQYQDIATSKKRQISTLQGELQTIMRSELGVETAEIRERKQE